MDVTIIFVPFNPSRNILDTSTLLLTELLGVRGDKRLIEYGYKYTQQPDQSVIANVKTLQGITEKHLIYRLQNGSYIIPRSVTQEADHIRVVI